jgi:cysteine desulfurase
LTSTTTSDPSPPLVYLDANATTRPAPEVVAAMLPYLRERWGNPSSAHAFGARLRDDIEAARERVAALLGARPAEVVFTSGGTESIATATRGALALGRAAGRRRAVTSAVEHEATRGALAALASEGTAEVVEVGVGPDGALDTAALEEALAADARPALLTLLLANNETGILHPVAEAAARARAAGALVHVDAVQAAGKVPLDARALGADLVSISAHKFHGPKGIGALYVRSGLRLPPLLPGHQEAGRRGGTEDAAAITGMGVAADLARAHLASGGEARVAALRDRLEGRILAALPGARRSGAAAPRLAGTSSLRIPGLDAAQLLVELGRRGVMASSGAACASGSLAPSHVLLAMGVPEGEARGALRLSLSRETTGAEVERAAAVIVEVAGRMLRSGGGA